MKRWFAILCFLALAAPLAHATVPSTMSYQGVLSDNLGNVQPDGLYNFVFKIYTVGSGGSAIWTETDNSVQLTKGSFTVLLGNVTPLNLAFDVPYYLGISVNGQPELTPRVPLASSAYGLSLRLPFAGTETSSGAVFSITNAGSGPAVQVNNRLDVGTTLGPGSSINWYGNGAASPVGRAYNSAYGGQMDLYDNNGVAIGSLQTNSPTAGYMFVLGGESGFYGIGVAGARYGPTSPWLGLIGNLNYAVFDMSQTGDGSVTLPPDAIDASETLDEPGIAQNHTGGSLISITSTSLGALTDLISVTITIPAPGYITLLGDFQANLSNNATSRFIGYQISTTSGAALDFNNYFNCGQSGTNFAGWLPCSIHRTYFESTAGTYTFYLQAYNGAGSGALAWDPTLTATYYATSYGTVTAVVAASDASRFPHATPTSRASVPGQVSGPGYRVDLSELEHQVAQKEAELRTARLRLDQARFHEQAVTARPAAAAPQHQP